MEPLRYTTHRLTHFWGLAAAMTVSEASARDVIQELWALCDALRDDGVTAQDYLTELTYLLFLKMLSEQGHDNVLPESARWDALVNSQPANALAHYSETLATLAIHTDKNVATIFANARTSVRNSATLMRIIGAIQSLSWYASDVERIGDIYEGLLEKIATDRKSGAGQYFTPRALVDCLVSVTRPVAGEIIQDPAAGAGGFLIAAKRAVDARSGPKGGTARFIGSEIVPDTFRLLLMNFLLHDMKTEDLVSADTLSAAGTRLPTSDLVLSNPPFGVSKGGRKPDREDLTLTGDSRNKQLAFIEHIGRALRPGGRAAVIVPDNVLFAGGVARQVRTWLLDEFVLHTILRLPSGIFYAQGIRTSVLFFNRIAGASTKDTWFYDLRAGLPAFGRSRPLRFDDFADFILQFGEKSDGSGKRIDAGETESRFRKVSREELAKRNDTLDVIWLVEPDASEEELEEPRDILDAVREHMQRALAAVETLAARVDAV